MSSTATRSEGAAPFGSVAAVVAGALLLVALTLTAPAAVAADPEAGIGESADAVARREVAFA
ncbi:hypothetical protein [Halorubrum halophilum]|uniref:hypothetical protein n=1 Tax=Halorubrum halophilum TaxID=413816 RepID=UPI00067956CC|nr:hypothetical protein [Halorubrum halophilum]